LSEKPSGKSVPVCREGSQVVDSEVLALDEQTDGGQRGIRTLGTIQGGVTLFFACKCVGVNVCD
jgi:hypothetical protein